MPDPIKAKCFQPNTFVYAPAQMKRVIRERDDNLILAHELKAENARLRDVLKRIAEHGCGCDPVCVCRSEGHIRIELDEKISLAKEALKATE